MNGMDMFNDIVAIQAIDENKLLLRARDRNYRKAKLTQGIFVVVSVMLPIIGVLFGSKISEVKPFVALFGLVLILIDTTLIDHIQKDSLKRGAKLQEQFDTNVLKLPWNEFLVGARVEPEDVHSLSGKPVSAAREEHFNNWYDPCVSQIPQHLARFVCQRANISYDARLRKKYGTGLLYVTIFFGIVLLLTGLVMKLKFSDLLVTLVIPFMPVLNWALKERLQQVNTANFLTNLCAEWTKMWERALNGVGEDESMRDSRRLQDAIYQHRERSPLVFNWVYYYLREVNEDEAHHASENFVEMAMRKFSEGEKL
jgi:hypothetical protein